MTFLEAEPGRPSRPTAGEVVAILHQDDGGTWLYVGDGFGQHLELSLDSWRRVIAVGQRLLAVAAGEAIAARGATDKSVDE